MTRKLSKKQFEAHIRHKLETGWSGGVASNLGTFDQSNTAKQKPSKPSHFKKLNERQMVKLKTMRLIEAQNLAHQKQNLIHQGSNSQL